MVLLWLPHEETLWMERLSGLVHNWLSTLSLRMKFERYYVCRLLSKLTFMVIDWCEYHTVKSDHKGLNIWSERTYLCSLLAPGLRLVFKKPWSNQEREECNQWEECKVVNKKRHRPAKNYVTNVDNKPVKVSKKIRHIIPWEIPNFIYRFA